MSKNTVQNLTTDIPKMGVAGLLYGFPGATEASEAAGQAQLVVSDVLPIGDIPNHDSKPILEAWGIKYGDPVDGDPLFIHVELPTGWSKRKTEHSMWSDLVDDKGHVRAGIFYKAAFYDRNAHISAFTRLRFCTSYGRTETYGMVLTSDRVEVFRTATERLPGYDWKEDDAISCRVRDEAKKWLVDNYPDFQSPLFYWDLDVENGEKPLSWFESGPFDGDEEWDRIRFEFLCQREDGTVTLDEYAPRFPKYAQALRQFIQEFDDLEEGVKRLEAEDLAAGRDPNAVPESAKNAWKTAMERIGMDATTIDEAATQIVVQEPYKCLGCETMINSCNLCVECGKKNGEAIAQGEDHSSNYGMDSARF